MKPRLMRSGLTDTIYIVTRYRDLGEGRYVAQAKYPVDAADLEACGLIFLQESGSPRGVTPALTSGSAEPEGLDVERLAEALRASPSLLLEGDDKDRHEFAEYIAAEYARLGSEPTALPKSPEDSDG